MQYYAWAYYYYDSSKAIVVIAPDIESAKIIGRVNCLKEYEQTKNDDFMELYHIIDKDSPVVFPALTDCIFI